MPVLSKSDEVNLLLRVLECSAQSEDWSHILGFIDDKLECKSFLSVYDKNGSPKKELSGNQSAQKLSDMLKPALPGSGQDALEFLITEAPLLYPFCKTTLNQGDFNGKKPLADRLDPRAHEAAGDAGTDHPKQATAPPEMPGLVSPIKRTENLAILFGCLFTAHTLETIDIAQAHETFRKISNALAPGIDTYLKIEKERSDNRIQTTLLSSVTSPAVLISAERIVLGQTRSGIESLIKTGAAVHRGKKLHFKNKQLDARLQALLQDIKHRSHQAADKRKQTDNPPLSGHSIYVDDQEGHLKRITLDVVADPENGSRNRTAPWVIIRISRPLELPEDIETVLQERYDLSHSEAHLARHLTATGSLNDTVDQLGITRNTAKTHLRRAFEKTGVHTQLQLARLVHSLSGLF